MEGGETEEIHRRRFCGVGRQGGAQFYFFGFGTSFVGLGIVVVSLRWIWVRDGDGNGDVVAQDDVANA